LRFVIRLQEVERESQELASHAAVHRETLAALQSDLVTQKLNTQQLRSSLEKLGLDLDQLMDPEVALEKYVVWLLGPCVSLEWERILLPAF
jgi:hypothetical protein